MHRHFCASIFIIYLLSCNILLALAGKPQEVKEVKLYHQVKENLDIELFVFNNETGDENFEYLTTTVPELIASQIELNKNIIVSSNNIVATPIGYNEAYSYKVITYTNTTYTSNYANGELVVITNTTHKNVTNNITRKDNVKITDANSTPLTLPADEDLYIYKGEPVILKGNNNFIRDINVLNSFQKYNNNDIKEYAFTRNADIVIFGDIKKTRYTITITAYIAQVHAKTLTSYSIEINDFELEQVSQIFAIDIANQMNDIEKTGTVNISSEPEESLLYLDGTYIGKTTTHGIKIPSLTIGEHRITVTKEDYQTIDKVFSFEEPLEDINMKFNLLPLTNVGKIIINVPGGTNTTVIFNGITEPKNDVIEKNLNAGKYSLKMMSEGYEDYFASIVLGDNGEYNLAPELKKIPEQTLARRIFGNYERNTKIGIGLTIAAGIFTVGAIIYSSEIYDRTVIEHVGIYGDQSAQTPLDLTEYNTAYNFYIAGIATTSVFALATGIFYLLWISQSNFDVEDIYLNGLAKNNNGFSFNVSICNGAAISFSKRF